MSRSTPISVIICTHNPRADYLARTLAALRAQTLPSDQWELVVVDNRSAEPLESRLDLTWRASARVVREDQLGLTPARLRGIAEAKGELLVLVDDDNVLAPDYLATALEVALQRPFLGAWSGQCLPEFEVEPPSWSERYWGNLCIRRFEEEVWSNLPRLAESMPAGAGMCVRRDVARRYLELHEQGGRTFQFDRTGDSLISGGDNDLAAGACALGYGVGLIPRLRLTHLISSGRVTEDYIERLNEGIHFSSTLLDAEHGMTTPPRTLIGRAVDMMRLMRLRPPHRRLIRAAFRGRDRAADLLARQQADDRH